MLSLLLQCTGEHRTVGADMEYHQQKPSDRNDAAQVPHKVLATPFACGCGAGILPVLHGRDAHAARGFARASHGCFSIQKS